MVMAVAMAGDAGTATARSAGAVAGKLDGAGVTVRPASGSKAAADQHTITTRKAQIVNSMNPLPMKFGNGAKPLRLSLSPFDIKPASG